MINILVIMIGILSVKMFIDLNQNLKDKEKTITKWMKFLYVSILLFIFAYVTIVIPIYFLIPLNIPSEYKAYIILGYWIISTIFMANINAKKKENE